MVNETKYGIISDVHAGQRVVASAVWAFKEEGVDKIIANGDIVDVKKSSGASQYHLTAILGVMGLSGLETYVQPGSHETIDVFSPAIERASLTYPNIVDVMKHPVIDAKDHRLAFLPGSDWTAGGEYVIVGEEDMPTGTYVQIGDEFREGDLFDYLSLWGMGVAKGIAHFQNMGDLRNRVADPDKTIVVCHVPRKFENLENCVDMAYFAEKSDGSVMPGVIVENAIRRKVGNVSYRVIERIARKNGLTFKTENRGNPDLRDLYQELGIRKAVSGHFHESGHRANDGEGNHVPQGTLVDELYWNSGHLEAGQTGILTVNDGRVSYRNIMLELKK